MIVTRELFKEERGIDNADFAGLFVLADSKETCYRLNTALRETNDPQKR